MSTNINNPYVVLFVEGDTDKVFFNTLLQYYRNNTTKHIVPCEIFNIRGVCKYTKTIIGKIEKGIRPRIRKKALK